MLLYLVFSMTISGNGVVLDFPTAVQLYCQCIGCGLLLSHSQGKLCDGNLWKSPSISKILSFQNRNMILNQKTIKEFLLCEVLNKHAYDRKLWKVRSLNVNKIMMKIHLNLHPVFLAPILFCDHKVELFFCSLLASSEQFMTEQA